MDFIVDAAAGEIRWRNRVEPVVLGKGGWRADKREGDGATPLGRFPLRRVLWRPDRGPRPQTNLPEAAIDPGDGWCDDPTHGDYNRAITIPHPAHHERLWRDDGVYDLILVIGHNDDPVIPGHGSAVFVHLVRPERTPTEGCVAMSEAALRGLLADASPGDWLTITA